MATVNIEAMKYHLQRVFTFDSRLSDKSLIYVYINIKNNNDNNYIIKTIATTVIMAMVIIIMMTMIIKFLLLYENIKSLK